MKESSMMALGVIAVAIVAVAVLGTLWSLSQIASADPGCPPPDTDDHGWSPFVGSTRHGLET